MSKPKNNEKGKSLDIKYSSRRVFAPRGNTENKGVLQP